MDEVLRYESMSMGNLASEWVRGLSVTPISPAISHDTSTFRQTNGFSTANFAKSSGFRVATDDLARVSTAISFSATKQSKLAVDFQAISAAAAARV